MEGHADLMETIIAAAFEAVRNQTPAITGDAGRLKSIALELELSNAGDVVDSTCWVERRGVHWRKEPTG
jgi:hypothetical protein